jgi:hypothetical protein
MNDPDVLYFTAPAGTPHLQDRPPVFIDQSFQTLLFTQLDDLQQVLQSHHKSRMVC